MLWTFGQLLALFCGYSFGHLLLHRCALTGRRASSCCTLMCHLAIYFCYRPAVSLCMARHTRHWLHHDFATTVSSTTTLVPRTFFSATLDAVYVQHFFDFEGNFYVVDRRRCCYFLQLLVQNFCVSLTYVHMYRCVYFARIK